VEMWSVSAITLFSFTRRVSYFLLTFNWDTHFRSVSLVTHACDVPRFVRLSCRPIAAMKKDVPPKSRRRSRQPLGRKTLSICWRKSGPVVDDRSRWDEPSPSPSLKYASPEGGPLSRFLFRAEESCHWDTLVFNDRRLSSNRVYRTCAWALPAGRNRKCRPRRPP
jgi:hypothetical protein